MRPVLLFVLLLSAAGLGACTATPIHLPSQGDSNPSFQPDAPATGLDGAEDKRDSGAHKRLDARSVPPGGDGATSGADLSPYGGDGASDARFEGGLADGVKDGLREARPGEAGATDLKGEQP